MNFFLSLLNLIEEKKLKIRNNKKYKQRVLFGRAEPADIEWVGPALFTSSPLTINSPWKHLMTDGALPR